MRFLNHARGLIAGVLLLCVPAMSNAADSSKLAARGKAILQEKCGRCHAVEAVGESPLKIAPPMRDIYARFPPRELQEELLEGKVSRHKAMPQIEFSHEDVGAIMAYLYALAVRK
jgi:cytochrome c